jgi:hypothetical protein
MERRWHGLHLRESGRICEVSLEVAASGHMPEARGVFRIKIGGGPSDAERLQRLQGNDVFRIWNAPPDAPSGITVDGRMN